MRKIAEAISIAVVIAGFGSYLSAAALAYGRCGQSDSLFDPVLITLLVSGLLHMISGAVIGEAVMHYLPASWTVRLGRIGAILFFASVFGVALIANGAVNEVVVWAFPSATSFPDCPS